MLYHATQVVWYILGIINVFLLLRLFLKLAGANPDASFSALVYNISYFFVAPFFSVFRITPVAVGTVFEWTTLLAMFIYWLIAVAIVQLLLMGRKVSTFEATTKLNEQE